MIVASVLQNDEEDFLTKIDRICVNDISIRLKEVVASGEAGMPDPPGSSGLRDLVFHLKDLIGEVRSQARNMDSLTPDRFEAILQQFADSLAATSDCLSEKLSVTMKQHGEEFARYVQELQEDGIKLSVPCELSLHPRRDTRSDQASEENT